MTPFNFSPLNLPKAKNTRIVYVNEAQKARLTPFFSLPFFSFQCPSINNDLTEWKNKKAASSERCVSRTLFFYLCRCTKMSSHLAKQKAER